MKLIPPNKADLTLCSFGCKTEVIYLSHFKSGKNLAILPYPSQSGTIEVIGVDERNKKPRLQAKTVFPPDRRPDVEYFEIHDKAPCDAIRSNNQTKSFDVSKYLVSDATKQYPAVVKADVKQEDRNPYKRYAVPNVLAAKTLLEWADKALNEGISYVEIERRMARLNSRLTSLKEGYYGFSREPVIQEALLKLI